MTARFDMTRNMYQPRTSRDLLRDLGVGDYNATMLIETLMMSPATTEANASPTMLLVGHVQERLNDMGASLVVNGYIDQSTADALSKVAGKGFLYRSWFDVIKDVVVAIRAGTRLYKNVPRPNPKPVAVGAFDLPYVPGGTLTYVAGGLLLWHLLKKKKRTSP